jgi:hypothetical protein
MAYSQLVMDGRDLDESTLILFWPEANGSAFRGSAGSWAARGDAASLPKF